MAGDTKAGIAIVVGYPIRERYVIMWSRHGGYQYKRFKKDRSALLSAKIRPGEPKPVVFAQSRLLTPMGRESGQDTAAHFAPVEVKLMAAGGMGRR